MSKVVPFARSAEYLHKRASLNRRERRPLDALNLLRRALEREPDNMEIRMDLAETLCEMGCHVQSNRVLTGILAEQNGLAECFFGMCCNFFGMNDLNSAYRAMAHFLSADPRAVTRPEVAGTLKELMLSRASERVRGRRARRATRVEQTGRRFLKAGDYPSSEAWARKSLALMPSHSGARALLAASLLNGGDRAGALCEMRRALKRTDVDPQTLAQAAGIYERAGKKELAWRALDRLLAAGPSGGSVYAGLDVALRLGDSQRARALIQKALAAMPYDRTLLHRCAINLALLGRPARESAGYWARILRIDPDDPVAKYYLEAAQSGGDLTRAPSDYRLPEDECARRVQSLETLAYLLAPQIEALWDQSSAPENLCRWALRSGDLQAQILAFAALEGVERPGIESLLREYLMDNGPLARGAIAMLARRKAARPYVRMSGEGLLILRAGGESGDIHMPLSYKSALRLALRVSFPAYGDLSAPLIKLWLRYIASLGEIPVLRHKRAWAAGLLLCHLNRKRASVAPEALAELFGCSPRAIERRAQIIRRVTRGGEKTK